MGMKGIMARAALVALAALAVAAAPAMAAKKAPPKLGKVKTVAASAASDGAQTPLTVTATCPSGKKAVGGGWTTPPVATPNAIFVYQAHRGAGESWTVTARTGLNTGTQLTTYVYCRKVKKAITEVTSTSATPAVGGGEATATAQCPGSRKLIAGGFSATKGNLPGDVAYPLAAYPSGLAWIYTAHNNVSESIPITSYAYCAKGIKNPAIRTQSATQTVPTNGALQVSTPNCPKKKPRLGAGGFQNRTTSGAIPFVLENRANGKSWLVSTYNIAVATPTSDTAFGICLQK
jgi:hypothetical protein